ncbi:MAG: hypothetical protein P8129_07800 [Anaerolineae bacterium]
MTIEVEQLAPPVGGKLQIDISLSATVNITGFSARQKVSGYVADELSTQMHGGTPKLVVGERIAWRVPVILSLPPSGDLGEVGYIDVDVETGELLTTEESLQEIKRHAKALASGAAS